MEKISAARINTENIKSSLLLKLKLEYLCTKCFASITSINSDNNPMRKTFIATKGRQDLLSADSDVPCKYYFWYT